jgi:hypothetical protein
MITITSVLVRVVTWSVVNRGIDMITITSVLVRVLAWSVVNRGIEPRSDKTKRHMKLIFAASLPNM